MDCGHCGHAWTEAEWHGNRTYPYVAVCDFCFKQPVGPSALDLALERHIGVKRWVPGTPMPKYPDECVHSVPLNLDSCAACKEFGGGVMVRDVNKPDLLFSPRFLSLRRPIAEFGS